MGCTSSKIYNTDAHDEDKDIRPRNKGGDISAGPQSELTENEIRIIKSTWHYMTGDLPGNGLQIFLKAFELCPDAKTIFNLENVRHSDLAKNEVIRAHGSRFMNAISAAIYCLRDDVEEKDSINAFLLKLGEKHKKADIKAEYFAVFHEALMWRWQICIGEEFTQEVSDIWKRVFDYMLERINQGYIS